MVEVARSRLYSRRSATQVPRQVALVALPSPPLPPPSAAAAIPAETAGAVGPPVAGPHHDLHAPPSGNASLHRGHAAAVDDHSVSDLHAASNGRLASTATREDQNAPVA